MRVQAIARGHLKRDALQESRRLEWYEYYSSNGDYNKAMELAVTQEEIEATEALRSRLPSDPPDASLASAGNAQATKTLHFPHGAAPQDDERPFVRAIKAHDWAAAEALAETDDDRLYLSDSKTRVEWLTHYTAQGEYDRAREMAITNAEVAKIEAARLEEPSITQI